MHNATLYNQYFIRSRCFVGIWSNIKLIMQFLPLVGTITAKVKGINKSAGLITFSIIYKTDFSCDPKQSTIN